MEGSEGGRETEGNDKGKWEKENRVMKLKGKREGERGCVSGGEKLIDIDTKE